MQEPESLEDSTLDRELQALLTVDPSPEFMARIRVAVAQQPARTFLRGWLVASVAAAAAVIVAGISLSIGRESRLVDDAPPIVTHSGANIELPAAPARLPEQPDGPIASRPLRLRQTQPPVVLVWHEETEAFQELVNDIAKGRFEVGDGPVLPQQTGVVRNVAIPPIVFDPIELSPIDQGAFQ